MGRGACTLVTDGPASRPPPAVWLVWTAGVGCGCAVAFSWLPPVRAALLIALALVLLLAARRPVVGVLSLAALLPLEAFGRLGGLLTVVKLLALITAIAVVYHRALARRPRHSPLTGLDIAVGGYAIVLCMDAVRSPADERAILDTLVVVAPPIIYALARVGLSERRHVLWAVGAVLAGASAVATYGLVDAVLGGPGHRTSASYADPNRYACLLAALSCFPLALACSSRRWPRWASAGCFLLLTAAAFATGSRTGALAWTAGTAHAVLRSRKWRATVLLAGLALALGALLAPRGTWTRFRNMAKWHYDPRAPGSGGSGRAEALTVALRAAGERPLAGLGRTRYLRSHHQYARGAATPRSRGTPLVAQNAWLELALIGGMPAAAAFTCIMVLAYGYARHLARAAARQHDWHLTGMGLGGMGAVTAFAVAGLFLGVQQTKHLFLVVALPVCALATLRRQGSFGVRLPPGPPGRPPTASRGRGTHVVQLLGGNSHGGIATHGISLTRALNQRPGTSAELWVLGAGPVASRARNSGVEVELVGPSGASSLRLLRDLRSLLMATRPDILHCHGYKAGILGRLAARSCGLCVVSTFHGPAEAFPGLEGLKMRAYAALDTVSSRLLDDAAIAVSEPMRHLIAGPQRTGRSVWVIPNWVDRARCIPSLSPPAMRRSLHLPPDKLVVTMVGRLVPVKRFDLALDAGASLLKSRPDVHFLLVGEGRSRGSLEALAREHDMQRSVSFLGLREDVADVLNCSDIVLVTSAFEGGGLVALEAMALGKPVVATAVGAIPTVLRDGQTGLLVHEATPRAIAARLKLLVDDAGLRESLGRASRRFVLAHMTSEAAVERHVTLYRAVLSACGAPAPASPEGALT